MHDRLSEVLDEEVVGRVTQVGNAFFDVGLGRVCLDTLDPDHVGRLVERVERAFPGRVQKTDLLHLDDPGQPVRGWLLLTIEERQAPYVLQITGKPVAAYHEQCFMLEPELYGDLWGTLCHGLFRLVQHGELSLQAITAHDELLEEHRHHQDVVVRHAVDGYDVDPRPRVEAMVEAVRRAWRLIPWPLRQGIQPTSQIPHDRIADHDRVLRRTLLLAVDLCEGEVAYQYVHKHNPLEEYDQVLGWMTEVYVAMRESYPPPHFAAALARASSVERFVTAFPGFRRVVGGVLEPDAEEAK